MATPTAQATFAARAAAQQHQLEQDIAAQAYAWSTTPDKFTLGFEPLPGNSGLFTVTEWGEDREEVPATAADLRALRDYLNSLPLDA